MINLCDKKVWLKKKNQYFRQGFLFGLFPSPPWVSSLASYFPFKHLAINTPCPLAIFNDHPWYGYGYFNDRHKLYKNAWEEHWTITSVLQNHYSLTNTIFCGSQFKLNDKVYNHLRTRTIVQYSSHTSFITGIMTSACLFSHMGKMGTTLETTLRATKCKRFVTAPQKVLSREWGPTRLQMLSCIKQHHKQPMESNRSKPGFII